MKSINQSEFKMPTSVFFQKYLVLIRISRGENGHLPPLRTPMRSLTILYQVSQTRPAHLMNRRNVF